MPSTIAATRFGRVDEHDRAMRDYDEAIRLDPHYAHAFNNRGIIFLELGDADRADRGFRSRYRAKTERTPTPSAIADSRSRIWGSSIARSLTSTGHSR